MHGQHLEKGSKIKLATMGLSLSRNRFIKAITPMCKRELNPHV